MPLVSGMEMVATLRSDGRHDFVVGLTGDASATDQDRFRQAGADEYVWN
jgi:osomolarity two-component system, sensor histidine kinase SLN1